MLLELILLFLIVFIPLLFSKQVYHLNNSITGRLILVIFILILSMCRTYLALILIIIYICLSQMNYNDPLHSTDLAEKFSSHKVYSYDLLNIMNILNTRKIMLEDF